MFRTAQYLVIASLLVPLSLAAAEGDVRLIEAVKNRDPQAVRTLLDQGVDVNAPQADGATALLLAAYRNEADLVDMLVGAGATVDAANDLHMTPLHLACVNSNAAIVGRLLTAGADPNLRIATGETPVMTCARAGSTEAVGLLLARGADVNGKEPLRGQTALMWAVSERHPEVVKALLEGGADATASTVLGSTAMQFAARGGDLDSAQLLLDAGVDVDIRSTKDPMWKGPSPNYAQSDGSTPLLTATMRGQIPFALFLLEKEANPNDDGAGMTPLHWAAGVWENEQSNPVLGFVEPMSGVPDRQAKLDLVNALLAHGADPNAQISKNPPRFVGGYRKGRVGATPAFLAAYALDLELLQILRVAGADLSMPTAENVTPLMAAAGLGRRLGYSDAQQEPAIEVVNFLLEHGNDAATVSTNGENALHGVAYLGWNDLLRILVDRGADVNAVSKIGTTPYLAAEGLGDRQGGVNYHKETSALLVELGADPKLGAPCLSQGACS